MEKLVYHKLLGVGKLDEVQWENATVWFIKKVPLNQIFPSREAMLGDWRKENIDWIEQYKKNKSL